MGSATVSVMYNNKLSLSIIFISGEIEESKDDDDDSTSPQRLALLSLGFEEKRRQIEAERQRSQEQWEEERRKLGETTFWYTIGRARGNDKDSGNAVQKYEVCGPQ